MTEAMSSQLGTGLEITLMSNERRSVPVILEEGIDELNTKLSLASVSGGLGSRNEKCPPECATLAPQAITNMLNFLRRLFGATPNDTGGRGEQLAAAWLRRELGYEIVSRNWRSPRDRRDELDLVCRDGDVLVFVEVKARSAAALVPGYYAVDERKKRALRRAASVYLAGLRVRPRTFRFDVVEVTLSPTGWPGAENSQVLHFANVPLFPKRFS
jgi:putative endonuclease